MGEKRLEKLASCGIYDPLDLLLLFPAFYYDRRLRIDWYNISDGEEVVFEGAITDKPSFKRIKKGLSFIKAKFGVDGTIVTCTWFNQDYVYRQLTKQGKHIIYGKVKRTGKYVEITMPKILTSRDMDILPIYRLPKGLTQTVMFEAVRSIFTHIKINGYIGKELATNYGLLPLSEALKIIHFPQNIDEAYSARKSVALENLAYTLSAYNLLRSGGADKRTKNYANNRDKLLQAIDSLPFRLTADQAQAVDGIIEGMHSSHRANILLQGDVGSGKTIVAFLSMYYAALSGYQSVIMAPTEVLARQHYRTASDFFERFSISVGCLLGSMPTAEKRTVTEGIQSGKISIIIGTHAVIGQNIEYKNLGLTVTDEQHRFGVCQRGSLENKTENSDNIVMSATPIPRTLALTLYGQLKSVVLNTRPSGKSNTITAIVPTEKIENMYGYIITRAKEKEKTFIVCPRIDSDDTVSVTSLYDELSKGALKNLKVSLLHGGQKENVKSEVMKEFTEGDTDVLISTTVIEVGIDVKRATTMIIFGADRFGLSQLHQLRGRVGRDGSKSYCFIVAPEKAAERLKFFCECADGFRLAEYDFDIRGAGDFLGTRQHGQASAFAGIKIDAEMIKIARKISDDLIADAHTAKAISTSAENKSEFIKSLTLN